MPAGIERALNRTYEVLKVQEESERIRPESHRRITTGYTLNRTYEVLKDFCLNRRSGAPL